MTTSEKNLGRVLKDRRNMIPLTLREAAKMSDISPSHLGRIERGERFPSAHVLRRIAKPLGFSETELFTLAGFLSSAPTEDVREKSWHTGSRLDPYVARALAEEPREVQRAAIGILNVMKGMAKTVYKENL